MSVQPLADDELPRTWPPTGLRPHRFAGIFRMLMGDEKDQLDQSVREAGVRQPIVIFQNAILDGRNRYLSAVDTGRFDPADGWANSPMFVRFEGTEREAIDLVWSLNEERRHDEKSERAMAAARRKKLLDEMAATDPGIVRRTDAQLAAEHGVSERLLNSANKVVEQAAPEVQRAVDEGRMSVTDAAVVSEFDRIEQRIIAEHPDRKAVKRAVQAARPKPAPVPELPSPLSRTALSAFAEEAVLLALNAAKKHKGLGASISADAILALSTKHDITMGGAKGHEFTRPMLLVLGRLRDTMPATPPKSTNETPLPTAKERAEDLYARLVADQGAQKGSHTQASAEPILRAADAAGVKIAVVATDIGAAKGSVAGWRGRLGLQKAERNPVHREGSVA